MGIRTRRRGQWSLVTSCVEEGYYERVVQLYLENRLVHYTLVRARIGHSLRYGASKTGFNVSSNSVLDIRPVTNFCKQSK